MRARIIGNGLVATALLGSLAFTATACSKTDESAVRQIQPGTTVFIDGWDNDGDNGDKALVEKKPSGLWVMPEDATFRTKRDKDHQVEVTLTNKGEWVLKNMGTTLGGYDHDNCLENDEQYLVVKGVSNIKMDPKDKPGSSDNDDCVKQTGDSSSTSSSTKKH